MAVNDSTSGSFDNGQRPSSDSGRTSRMTWDSFDFGNLPISSTPGNEVYTKMLEGLKETFAAVSPTAAQEMTISVVEMNRDIIKSLDFSCLIVTAKLRQHPELGVSAYLLLLEATGNKIEPRQQNINGQTVSVQYFPCDAVNRIMINEVLTQVRKESGTQKVRYVDGLVVPRTFNVNDKANILRVAAHAATAAYSELARLKPNTQPINLALMGREGAVAVNVAIQRNSLEDITGLPIRSDVVITTTNRLGATADQNREFNSGSSERRIVDLTGFMDVLWAPSQDAAPIQGFVPQHRSTDALRRFMPRFVITDMNTHPQTPEAVVLGVATATSLMQYNTWVQAFKVRNTSPNELDMTDIGALNIEGNLPMASSDVTSPNQFGKPMDTKSANFGPQQFNMFLSALFHPYATIAIDVPEYGPSMTYLSFMSAVASRNEEAYNMFITACNNLTNGRFGELFARNSPIFTSMSETILNGYWEDDQGRRRDIREFDYTAVANIVGTKNPTMIRDWTDTFLAVDRPQEIRLATRMNMINVMSNNTAVFTGRSTRHMFHSALMNALVTSIRDAGLPVTVHTPASGQDYMASRPTANYAMDGMIDPSASFYTRNGYNPAGYSNMGYTSFRY